MAGCGHTVCRKINYVNVHLNSKLRIHIYSIQLKYTFVHKQIVIEATQIKIDSQKEEA